MSMDKERLLAYFQDNYLPREEVLFKLPFSISIETFWPELLNRRKAKATVLPLRNGSGIPYWYTLTGKMIAASEKLCEKAITYEAAEDRFNAPMTGAMTEEMFFTSFIEGAQIQVTEAMSFLQSGSEPEDINEQMVWNNLQAWTAMAKSLIMPLDENYIKGLARLLTWDMDGQADDYRQTDTHPIAAMGSSPYSVPPAFVIPERMTEFYLFLGSPEVHPLIKSAAAQAFLLITRPFPEGNERLSRMVSAAVLLRSGYDYFRDISISSVIARENYLYYKAMKDIICSDNGGDMTYFMEYYLGLLVRAVNDREEREKRIEQERFEKQEAEQAQLLERERSMAVIPLTGAAPRDEAASCELENDEAEAYEAEAYEENADIVMPRQKDMTDQELLPENVSPDESPPADITAAYFARFRALAEGAHGGSRKCILQRLSIIQSFLKRGITQFTSSDYCRESGLSYKISNTACNYLLENGLITMKIQNNIRIYTMALPCAGAEQGAPDESSCSSESSQSLTAKTLCVIRRLSESGRASFTGMDIRNVSGITMKRIYDVCRNLVNKGLLATDRTKRPIVYRLTEEGAAKCRELDEADDDAFCNLMKKLDELGSEYATEREHRICSFLKERCREGRLSFTRGEWKKAFPFSESTIAADLRYAVSIGLIMRSNVTVKGRVVYEYTICTKIQDGISTDGLTENQYSYMTEIHRRFGYEDFTCEQLALLINLPADTVGYHLSNLLVRRLLRRTKNAGHAYIYSLAITPEEHPECFISARLNENRQEGVAALPAIPSGTGYAAAAVPSRSTAALSV